MGMTPGGGPGRRRALSEINVTPMVDIMLVLLIIFMVTAPLIVQGVDVDLPEARAQPIEDDAEKLILAVTKDRKIFLGDTEIPLEELETKLATNAKVQKEHELYLHADKSLPYGVVVEVMAIAKRAGVESLGLVTDPLAARETKEVR
ncbi:MAG: protein TolR [Deltaproteobacteria bacterium]|nr:MAG: protein TolR [Deltaproteobacteria bacterium]